MTKYTKKRDRNSNDTNNVLMVGLNTNGAIIQFNKACETTTGYGRVEAFEFLSRFLVYLVIHVS
jgi:hypothetical protein